MMRLHDRKQALLNKNVYISCIIPAFNEEAVIQALITQLKQFLNQVTTRFEIIIIDDGSHDQTVEKILDLPQEGIKLLSLSRNFGKEIALTAGLDYCSGDIAILMDADFQHPIVTIDAFLTEWVNGYHMVYGIRNDRESESYIKRNFARAFYWVMKKMSNIKIPNNAGDFRLLDRKVVDAFKAFPERARFMKGLYGWVGFKKIGVPFDVKDRAAGQSSLSFYKLTELALTGITSFSNVPLRIWGVIGFVVSFFSLIYAIYIVTVTLLYGTDLPGFPTLIVSIMFLGGMQLLSVGILGEYIARIFTEVKQRPKYLIQMKQGFDEQNN